MTYQRKTAAEKLADPRDLPKIVNYKNKQGEKISMALPAPKDVIELMKKVPKGKLMTTAQLKSKICKKYGTQIACPLVSGIFVRLVGEVHEQDKKIPYWRTIKEQGLLNEKYPGGMLSHKKLLMAEGFKIKKIKQKFFVEDFEKYLIK